jgi:hypothetical protein
MPHLAGILVILLSTATMPRPAHSLEDVLGWEGTVWGMSQSDVAAYAASHGLDLVPGHPALGGPTTRNIPFHSKVEIGGYSCDVGFQFSDRTQQLNAVVIGAADVSRDLALRVHASLLRALTARHGPPSSADSRGSVAAVTRWTSRTTTIALRLDTDTPVRGQRATHVYVVYAPTELQGEHETNEKMLLLALLKLLAEGRRP